MNGGVPNKGLNEQLHDILDQSSSTRDLHNILDQLEQDINLLNNPNNIQHIMFLLQAGADPNTKGQDGKTLSYYLNEKLCDILNRLASNSNLLDDSNFTQHIMFLLQAGANPNIKTQDGKTLLHYVAELNNINGIKFLLNVRADPNVRDHSGKTPFEYVTERNCLKDIKDLGCSSNDKTTCTKLSDPDPDKDQGYHSDGSCENEENPAKSPNNDNRTPTDQQTSSERPVVSDRDSEDSSDYYSEDEDSSCSSSDYLFLEDSLLAKLGIPLTTDEQELIDKFCKEIRGITAQNKQESEGSILESIKRIAEKRLEGGPRLNSCCSCCKKTVTNLIFKEIDDVLSSNNLKLRDETGARERQSDGISDQDDDNEDKVSGIIESITNKLLLKGGKARQKFFFGNTDLAQDYGSNYINNLSKECEEIESKLISIACEGIVNKSKQTHEYDFKAEIDNVYFYVKYPQDSIIEPVKIFNKAEDLKDEALDLKVGILQIGESIVRVEGTKDGKRNYTDVLKGSIKMSFTTEVGEISIYLSPSEKDGNKIKVEIDEENKARLNKLKAEKKSLGENCLLGGKSVLEAIEDKGFKKNGNVSTESTEITKDVPFTNFMQACSQQIDTSVKGR